MTMAQLKQMAVNLGIPAKGSKKQLTRDIQIAEGNNPCFGVKICHNKGCLFWFDCQKLTKPKMKDLL